jgi:hypothetical protein
MELVSIIRIVALTISVGVMVKALIDVGKNEPKWDKEGEDEE